MACSTTRRDQASHGYHGESTNLSVPPGTTGRYSENPIGRSSFCPDRGHHELRAVAVPRRNSIRQRFSLSVTPGPGAASWVMPGARRQWRFVVTNPQDSRCRRAPLPSGAPAEPYVSLLKPRDDTDGAIHQLEELRSPFLRRDVRPDVEQVRCVQVKDECVIHDNSGSNSSESAVGGLR